MQRDVNEGGGEKKRKREREGKTCRADIHRPEDDSERGSIGIGAAPRALSVRGREKALRFVHEDNFEAFSP